MAPSAQKANMHLIAIVVFGVWCVYILHDIQRGIRITSQLVHDRVAFEDTPGVRDDSHDTKKNRVENRRDSRLSLGNVMQTGIEGGDVAMCTASNVTFRGQSHFDESVYQRFYQSPPRCGGIIVEMGALDGQKYSNSWGFEFGLHWTAVHIEGSPNNFKRLVVNRPGAINIHAAACSGSSVTFSEATSPEASGVQKDMPVAHKKRWLRKDTAEVEVPCRKLSDIFLEHRITEIDVFFLDVEGAELQAIETMDFDATNVATFIVEMDGQNQTKDSAVRSVLRHNGYTKVDDFHVPCHEPGVSKYCEPNEVYRRAPQ